MRLSVDLPIAEATTTTSLPWRRVNATLSATARIRSGSATDVPPYFWTINGIGVTFYPHRCGVSERQSLELHYRRAP